MSLNHGIFRPVRSGRLPRFSTQALLVLLILLLLGPGLVFTSMLLLRYATVERERYSLQALTTARQIAAVIDRDLNGLATTLSTLTTSTRLRAGDYATFHSQAEQVSKLTGAHVMLRAPVMGGSSMNIFNPFVCICSPSVLITFKSSLRNKL